MNPSELFSRLSTQVRITLSEPRAPRFPILLPLRYRPAGEENWREGITENISRSGVLFRASAPIGPKTPVEIELQLPGTGERAGAQVRVRGQIVRAVAGEALLAASFTEYRIDRLN